MSGMFLSMAEGFLGLTPDERLAVEPELPDLKTLLDTLNGDWDAIQHGLDLIVRGKPVLDRLIADMRVLGPAAATLLGEGMPDMMGAMSAGKDAANTIELNKAWTNQLQADYAKFGPLIAKSQELGPKVWPAIMIVVAAAKRKGLL